MTSRAPEASEQLLFLHEQIENESACVGVRALDLFDVATLPDAVDDLLRERAADVTSALAHDVQVLARVENGVCCGLEEERDSLRADRVVLLPVSVVVVLLQLFLLKFFVFFDEKLNRANSEGRESVHACRIWRQNQPQSVTCSLTSE